MKVARYFFAKRYEHWTLEDWKSVISKRSSDLRVEMNILRDILL